MWTIYLALFSCLFLRPYRTESCCEQRTVRAGKIKQKRIRMTRHIEFGKKGEELAAGWLTGKGFEILHRNWRHGRYEVDIIARYQDVVHFIEVKAGQPGIYGQPEERVSK